MNFNELRDSPEGSLERDIFVAACYMSLTEGKIDACTQHILEVAYLMQDARREGRNSCLWHACSVYWHQLDRCQCRPCETSRAAEKRAASLLRYAAR